MTEENPVLIVNEEFDFTDRILNSNDKYKTFLTVPTKKKGYVFLNLPVHIQEKFARIMNVSRIIKIIKYLDHDDIVDFLLPFTDKKKKRILKELEDDKRKKVEYLLKFDHETAAGLMNVDFILTDYKQDIEKLQRKVRRNIKKNKEAPLILVKLEGDKYGYVPLENFILDKLNDIKTVVEELPTVRYDEEHAEVIEKVKEGDFEYIVVIDDDNAVLGYIDISYLFRVSEKLKNEELYKFAGVKKEEDLLDSAKLKIKSRYLWLLINLVTAFMAAFVITLFEDTLSSLVILAAYLPIIAGMGGNAAIQTLTVVIRGIVLHDIDLKKRYYLLLQETLAALFNGVLNGLIVGFAAYIFNGMWMLGVVVFLALVLNLCLAAIFGTITPLVLKKFDIDPAVAGTVIVTTVTDVLGFFIYLGLAQMLLL